MENDVHPWKLTWNLEMMVLNRNLHFQGFIFRFHVCFGGCIFERNAWDRMDASRVGKFKVVLGEFSGHERRWRIHLLVEGSLGWKVGLKWRWNYDQNLMIYKKVAYRTKWFLTNKIFSQLRRTLVFEGDNFHRFSIENIRHPKVLFDQYEQIDDKNPTQLPVRMVVHF